ncbi:hypothetical protein B7L51_006460 [Pectobacterium brasiliense]|uniref:tail fiber/spike domain-containing protein n=1 Tax=Pectobacterium brasiliense TaxID=180957 RepID=UPI000B9654EA|nr:hypothetical protein [Pectobacterium carotovorum]OYN52127.1 hypothetical protein B7L51_06510 [Pectobacterium carotovorum]
MTTYKTGNPLGSPAAQDLYDNAQNLDNAVNNMTEENWTDRRGNQRKTFFGMEQWIAEQIRKFGYQPLVGFSFESGATIDNGAQALQWLDDGNYYVWNGEYPKVVPANSTPTTAGGIDANGWRSVGDATLRTELASDEGDTLSGTKGGVTQRQRNDVVRDIRDYGGVDDWDGSTGTNNHAAFVAAIADRPCKIYLPKTDTGIYYIEGTSSLNNVDGVEYVADPGVSIYTASDNINNVIRKPGAKSNRDFKIEVGGTSRFTHRLGSKMFGYPSSKGLIDQGDTGDLYIPEKLTFTSDFNPQYFSLSAWPAGSLTYATDPATLGITATDTTTNAITFTVPATSFIGAMFAAVPGDFLQASVRDGGNFPSVAVEIDGGWIIARQNVEKTAIAVNERWSTTYQVETNYPVKNLDIAPYNFGNASTGIVIFDSQSFGIVVNGVVICRHNTVRPIVSVGWACGYQNSSSSGGVCTIQYPTRIRGKKQFGIPPINLVSVGDSTGDRDVTIQSQFEFAAQYLAGIGGSQVTDLLNLSVRGETAAQQSARLLATDITGYDFCLIQVGINDIQAQSGYAAFATTIMGMIDYCKSHSVIPVVGIPAMFYTRADITTTGITTDHIGQNSGNSHRGTLYRLNLMQTLGAAGVQMNLMSHDAYGLVTPRLLAPGRSLVDPVMMDNIHQTVFGSMLMGMSWARAIAAWFTKSGRDGLRKRETVNAGKTGYIHLPARYFTAGGASATPYYTVNQDGKSVTLSYYLSRDNNTWAADQTLGALPERLRPVTDQAFATQPCGAGLVPISGAIAMVHILKDGTVKVMGASSATVFLPFSITYAI